MLERLRPLIAGDPRFEIVVNETNLGYVQSCIRGMQRTNADYIVLMNSDIVVTPAWLDRLELRRKRPANRRGESAHQRIG